MIKKQCTKCGWNHYAEPNAMAVQCSKCKANLCLDGDRAPDTGLGDTVERLLAKAGGRKVKAWLQSAGLDCGCTGRQARLNQAFPY